MEISHYIQGMLKDETRPNFKNFVQIEVDGLVMKEIYPFKTPQDSRILTPYNLTILIPTILRIIHLTFISYFNTY